MQIQQIRQIESEKIIKEITTVGSSPLQVLADGIDTYYAKTTTPQVPRVELINELICAYFAQCWDLKVPSFALLTISDIVIEKYISENCRLSNRYKSTSFGDNLFFASQMIQPMAELEKYILPKHAGLKEEILSGIEVVLKNIDFIFEQVPPSWGFSKKQKAHLKEFLSDNERNKRIATTYFS